MSDEKYIDFHTHLDWYENQDLLISQIVDSKIVCVAASVDDESYYKNLEIALKVKELTGKNLIIPTIGIHPCKVLENVDRLQDFDSLLEKSPLIGEIGMDFCWYKEASPQQQEKIFRYFLKYCNDSEKYCVIHTKDAEQQIADILLEYPKAKPVIHWYDGPEWIYRDFLKRGYLFTFGCETIRSEHIQKLLKITPVEQILCETDNPTGEPWLGGTDNSPMLIKRIYSDVAKIKGLDEQVFKRSILENFEKILGSCLYE